MKHNPRLWTTPIAIIEPTPQLEPFTLVTTRGRRLKVVPLRRRADLTAAQLAALPIAALRRARPAEIFGWAMVPFEAYNHGRTTGRSARKPALDEAFEN